MGAESACSFVFIQSLNPDDAQVWIAYAPPTVNKDPMHKQIKIRITQLVVLIALIVGMTQEATAAKQKNLQISSDQLTLSVDPITGKVQQLEDDATKISWRTDGARLWKLDQPGQRLEASLVAQASHPGEVVLTLSLHNPTDKTIVTDVSFPRLDGLTGGDAASLHYCFPRQDVLIGNQPIKSEALYSTRFPLQFVTAYLPDKGGVYLMTCDTDLQRKRFFLDRGETLSMGANYLGVTVASGQTIELPEARLGVYQGDWHEAFDAYRRWVAEWYQPAVPRKAWFRKVFNFRQVFLYPNLDTPGLFDVANKSLSIYESIEEERERFGAIDYVHVFDWSQTPDQGRVGLYNPWHHLPRQTFNQQCKKFQGKGTPFGLYFEGYLVSPIAKIPGRPGRDWQLKNVQGGKYDPFGSGDDYMCPGVKDWRTYVAHTVARVSQETPANGFYIDQLGFSYQYPCHDPTHGHALPSNQPRDEMLMLKAIRGAFPDDRVLYTEEAPVDVTTQYQDASFTYALMHSRHERCPSRVNLSRFAFPGFKRFHILRGDGPIGDDVEGVGLAFYNGDGLWLVGPSDNTKWYSDRVLATIRKTRALREQYLDAFTSDDVTPLVPTLAQSVYANRFASDKQTVWTLYNASDKKHSGGIIRVKHIPGAVYYDAWNQTVLLPEVHNGYALLSIDLGPKGIGCIVRSKR